VNNIVILTGFLSLAKMRFTQLTEKISDTSDAIHELSIQLEKLSVVVDKESE